MRNPDLAYQEHQLTVPRTARYLTLGDMRPGIRDVWFVCHGYGELASHVLDHAAVLEHETRLVIAPEGLSRFYTGRDPLKIGASWMTREDRLAEIEDYVGFLNLLHREILGGIERSAVQVHVLGFSQGAATAARWACHAQVAPDHLVLWGETLPPELDGEEGLAPLRSMKLSLVAGSRDAFATPERRADQRASLDSQGIDYEELSFDGGHRLDDATLRRLANDN